MQDRNITLTAELASDGTSVQFAGSGVGPSTTAEAAQAEIENVKKVVAKGAGIRVRYSKGEATASPP